MAGLFFEHGYRLFWMAYQSVAFVDGVDTFDDKRSGGLFAGFQDDERSEEFLRELLGISGRGTDVDGDIAHDIEHVARLCAMVAPQIKVNDISLRDNAHSAVTLDYIALELPYGHLEGDLPPLVFASRQQIGAGSYFLVCFAYNSA